jgi:hypothetical protein
MNFIIANEFWLLISFITGSVYCYIVAYQRGRKTGIEVCIDSLVETGYVRSSINDDGEIVIHKYSEEDESE